VSSLGKRGLDSLGHLQLAGPVFVIGVPLREDTLASKELARCAEFYASQAKTSFKTRPCTSVRRLRMPL
jgi:hypothetical protein